MRRIPKKRLHEEAAPIATSDPPEYNMDDGGGGGMSGELDRNYDLALKALERSMGHPVKLPQATQTEISRPQVLPEE